MPPLPKLPFFQTTIPTDEAISQFLRLSLSPEELREKASALLARSRLKETLKQRVSDQTLFLNKIYEVCQRLHLYRHLLLNTSLKAYPTIDVKSVRILGELCVGIMQLPDSVVLSGTVQKTEAIARSSGGFTDIWQGERSGSTDGSLLAIKAFRTYPQTELDKAKRVSKKSTNEVHSRTKFTDSLGACTIVEETLPRQHPTIPRCRHEPLPAFPCI